jgi:hypothetical protein
MFLWFHFSRGPRKIRRGEGYFNCPECRCRHHCDLFQVESRSFLWGIPLSDGEAVGPESYLCSGCQREFVADGAYGYDFGAHEEPETWRCFKCNGEVAYERFDCPHCGYRFDVGRRI